MPLRNLAKPLFLTSNSGLYPPLLHLGYLIDMDRIMEYAKQYGLIQTILGFSASPGDSDDEITFVYKEEMDPRTTRNAVFRHMEATWNLKTIRLRCIHVPVNGTLSPLMSITTNHSYLRNRPCLEDIHELGTKCTHGEKPRWYLDGHEGGWQFFL